MNRSWRWSPGRRIAPSCATSSLGVGSPRLSLRRMCVRKRPTVGWLEALFSALWRLDEEVLTLLSPTVREAVRAVWRCGDALACVEAPSAAAALRRSLDLHPLGDWTDDARELVVFPQDAYPDHAGPHDYTRAVLNAGVARQTPSRRRDLRMPPSAGRILSCRDSGPPPAARCRSTSITIGAGVPLW